MRPSSRPGSASWPNSTILTQAVREQTHDERQVIIPQQDEDTKTGKAAKGAPKGSKRRKMGAPVKSFGPLV